MSFLLTVLCLVLVFLRPQEYVDFLKDIPVVPLVVGAGLVSWTLLENKNLDSSQFRLLPALVGSMVLSIIATGWFGGSMLVLEKILPACVIFLLVSHISQDRIQLRRLMFVITVMVAIMAIHGIYQHASGIGWTGAPLMLGRITYLGIFNDPNDLGQALAIALPMAMYFFSTAGGFKKIAYLVMAGFVLYALFLTGSRGSMLAVLAMAGYFTWRHYGKTAAVTAAVVIVPVLLAMTASTRLTNINPEEESAKGRVDAWYAGLHMFLEHPLTGVGYGKFVDYNTLTAHNSFVLALAELGLPGYFFWLAFLGLSVEMMYRIAFKTRSPDGLDMTWQDELALAKALFLSLVGFTVAAFFLSRSYSMVLFVLCALSVGHYQGVRSRFNEIYDVRLTDHFGQWLSLTIASVIGLFITVKILLRFA